MVYLAQEPLASEPPPVAAPEEKASFWKRWLTPIPALSLATAAGTIILSFSLYQHFEIGCTGYAGDGGKCAAYNKTSTRTGGGEPTAGELSFRSKDQAASPDAPLSAPRG